MMPVLPTISNSLVNIQPCGLIDEGCPGEGHLLVFNNGQRNRAYSSVDEIITPLNNNGNYILEQGEAYGPEKPVWSYTAENPMDIYSMILSNAQRLPNGNTLICSAQQGLFVEVTPDKEVVWEYHNLLPTPFSNAVARVQKYAIDFPGLPESESLEPLEAQAFIEYFLEHL
jgi:hypothetical protein